MATQFYSTGPAMLYVGTAGGGALEFLGFSEDGVNITLNGHFENVNADYAGPVLPADVQFMGEEGFIEATLTRFSDVILDKLLVRLSNSVSGNPGNAGSIGFNLLGSFMVQAGYAFRLLVYGIYQPNTVQYPNMVAVYNFYQAFLFENAQIPISIRAKRPRIVCRAIPQFTIAASGGNATNVSYILYDKTTTGMPGPS
jgi:hypothetical protein